MYSIGRAAKAANVPIKTIRYYDEIGLIKSPGVSEAGYRMYDEKTLHKLIFVRHARTFGFSIDTCRELLDLYENPSRTSKEVKQIALQRLEEIRQKREELERLEAVLSHLAEGCLGDARPDCPIIEFLALPKESLTD